MTKDNNSQSMKTDGNLMRRDFIRSATLGMGVLAAAHFQSLATSPEVNNVYRNDTNLKANTLLKQKRVLGSEKNPLEVSSI